MREFFFKIVISLFLSLCLFATKSFAVIPNVYAPQGLFPGYPPETIEDSPKEVGFIEGFKHSSLVTMNKECTELQLSTDYQPRDPQWVPSREELLALHKACNWNDSAIVHILREARSSEDIETLLEIYKENQKYHRAEVQASGLDSLLSGLGRLLGHPFFWSSSLLFLVLLRQNKIDSNQVKNIIREKFLNTPSKRIAGILFGLSSLVYLLLVFIEFLGSFSRADSLTLFLIPFTLPYRVWQNTTWMTSTIWAVLTTISATVALVSMLYLLIKSSSGVDQCKLVISNYSKRLNEYIETGK